MGRMKVRRGVVDRGGEGCKKHRSPVPDKGGGRQIKEEVEAVRN